MRMVDATAELTLFGAVLEQANANFDSLFKYRPDQACKSDVRLKAGLNRVRRKAEAAAVDFAMALQALPRHEQVAVAEALVEAAVRNVQQLSKKPARKGNPEYNPDQARGADGQWTAGGAARAVGSVAATGGKMALGGLREALSKVTLVPSSKTVVSESLSSWWRRVNSEDTAVHVVAVQEGAARLMFTLFFGVLAVVFVDYYLSAAAGAVGVAVAQAIKVLIGG